MVYPYIRVYYFCINPVDTVFEFLKTLTDPESIVKYGGLWLLLFVIYAETGLFFGFFLPGDNLILIAGIISATRPEWFYNLPFPLIVLLMITAAVLGNSTGYWFGKKIGNTIYHRQDTFFFKKKHIIQTKSFYDKYGALTLILGRFLPIVRTFAPILAGVINVPRRLFFIYNVVGAVLWIVSLGSIAYFLGTYYAEWIEKNVKYIFIGLIVLTALPVITTGIRQKVNRTKDKQSEKLN
ncbi:MAG: alkaline phosphatase [Bacteroidia bacterium]|nr:MAG: alkaline phosphatase [Bacteroidia bacterium]